MKKILFVCTGNTCRSAMAGYLADVLAQRDYPAGLFAFDSAGLYAAPGAPPSDEAVAVLAGQGIDMSGHRAKLFSPYMIDRADLIVTMTAGHRRQLLADYPEAAPKTFLLAELAGSAGDIPDPWGGSLAEYAATRDRLQLLIAALLKKIAAQQENKTSL